MRIDKYLFYIFILLSIISYFHLFPMDSNEIQKWKSIILNWNNIKSILPNNTDNATQQANEENSTQFEKLIYSINEEYSQFLKKCYQV